MLPRACQVEGMVNKTNSEFDYEIQLYHYPDSLIYTPAITLAYLVDTVLSWTLAI